MASFSWKKTEKYYEDYFTINTISKLPAWDSKKCSFESLGLKPEIIKALQETDIFKPTKIQVDIPKSVI